MEPIIKPGDLIIVSDIVDKYIDAIAPSNTLLGIVCYIRESYWFWSGEEKEPDHIFLFDGVFQAWYLKWFGTIQIIPKGSVQWHIYYNAYKEIIDRGRE